MCSDYCMERTRGWSIVACAALAMGLGACNRNEAHRDEPPSKQAGRAAYEASQKIKEGARKAAKELNHAAKNAREGWNDAKREDRNSPKK